MPAGSGAVLADADTVGPSFVADEAGTYVVSLVVNDGDIDSDADNVTITATATQDVITDTLGEAIDVINALDPDVLKNENLAGALTNKINAALSMIDDGEYFEAHKKLQNDIRKKTNGCADAGEPDRNDWITTCDAQDQVYPLIMQAIDLLEELI